MKRNWIKNRKVILTGCSSGIGKELAIRLVKKYNCTLLGVARNEAKLKALQEEIGEKFTYYLMDVSGAEAWQGFTKYLEETNFQPDILINNAGIIQPFQQFIDLEMSQIQKVLNVNLNSILYSCRAMIPFIQKSPAGGIINVSSASAILPIGGQSIYSATKSAVASLTSCLDQELRGQGIYVSCIMPGPVKTDLYKAREADGAKAGESKVKDDLVANVGMSAQTAAKRIIKTIRKRKSRLTLGSYAKFMSLGMRLAPRTTPPITSRVMKMASGKVKSFEPIFKYELEHKKEIKQKLRQR